MLAKYLTEKKDDGFALLELDANEAVSKINADGYDFTAEELKEFADAMEKATATGELDESALDDVSGGIVPLVVAPFLLVTTVAMAVTHYVSYKRSKKR